jgi:hypothetical protein
MFGLTGILLNHRHVMKIPAAKLETSEIQLAVGEINPVDEAQLALLVQHALDIRQPPFQREEKGAGKAGFMGKLMAQPKVIKVEFHLPQVSVKAEYVPGNAYASLKREDANALAFLTRMHKGVGAHSGWVLLVDSIGGALMTLSITGVLLWTKLRRPRLVMAGLCGVSTGLALLFALQAM